jgi:hypothetical protein
LPKALTVKYWKDKNMSNYDLASKLLEKGGFELTLMSANAHAILALADEMRAAREPQVKEVYILQQYRPDQDREGLILDVYKDRDKAYSERDALNASAHNLDAPVRYIIREKSVK